MRLQAGTHENEHPQGSGQREAEGLSWLCDLDTVYRNYWTMNYIDEYGPQEARSTTVEL